MENQNSYEGIWQIRASSHPNVRECEKRASEVPGVEQVRANAHAAFLKVTACWGLTERQRHALLSGEPIGSTALASTLLTFNNRIRISEVDTLLRVSEVLEVFLLCRHVFQNDAVAARWLKSPSREPQFYNLTPLTWMIYGGPMGIIQLRNYLMTKRAGPSLEQVPFANRDASNFDRLALRIHSEGPRLAASQKGDRSLRDDLEENTCAIRQCKPALVGQRNRRQSAPNDLYQACISALTRHLEGFRVNNLPRPWAHISFSKVLHR
jgi:hypothetical protein